MPGPFINPQEIFDASTLIAAIVAALPALPPFINPGAIPAAYAPLVAAIVAALPTGAVPTKAEGSGFKTVISGVGAGTKGAWVQMIASTAAAGLGLILLSGCLTTGFVQGTFDIGLGAPGAEVATFKDIAAINNTAASPSLYNTSFYCFIPIHSGVSIRAADNLGALTYTFFLNVLEY